MISELAFYQARAESNPRPHSLLNTQRKIEAVPRNESQSHAISRVVLVSILSPSKVRAGSRVLDPFCGSCSLLLPAAHMGAQTWGSDVSGPATASEEAGTLVGGDTGADGGLRQADLEGLEQIYQDFHALGVVAPTLVAADVGDDESPVRRPE